MELAHQVSRKDVDISIKRIKSNLNSHLTFEQMVGVIEDIALRVIGFDSFSQFIEGKMMRFTSSLHDMTGETAKLSHISRKNQLSLDLS